MVLASLLYAPPLNTRAPRILGSPVVGNTVVAEHGDWSLIGAAVGQPITFKYRWYVDPNQTYESLSDGGSRLKPAEGWTFRTVVLESDLVLTPDDGSALITQDELGNTYDRVGGPFSSYKP